VPGYKLKRYAHRASRQLSCPPTRKQILPGDLFHGYAEDLSVLVEKNRLRMTDDPRGIAIGPEFLQRAGYAIAIWMVDAFIPCP
jgi:hypothetical protein